MAEATWEKPAAPAVKTGSGRLKFLIGGLLILAAVTYLIISGTGAGARYFMTVDELVKNPDYVGKTVRISGAVIGDTIQYDARNLIINFTIANIPTEYENLAEELHAAATDPSRTQLQVRVENQVKPDLLQHEAQAILTGTLQPDGTFQATELLLKCPTRFEEADPGKVITNPEA
ncbi:MAG: cytochrome c maturation protein CcmE [Chloroflexi bacterium]|nr:cytochrome c maturation protein CcmE [Chloroflexota bacterium]